jgi:hypothetical protein
MTECASFVVSLSNHEHTIRLPFDKLRANGKLIVKIWDGFPIKSGMTKRNVTPLLPDDYSHIHPISFVSFFDTAYDVFLPLF